MNNKIKKTLVCELTETERREYGINLATTLGDMAVLESEKKRVADNFKDRLSGLQAKVDELSTKVSSGREWRDVACLVLLGQPDSTHKQTVREDTKEVVSTDLMDERDLQNVLPFDRDFTIESGAEEEIEEEEEQ